ncbi:CotH kinase family protein [Antribacter gilvus]|uniref:CotH kinase family protein n=1 Tax=Antribacter gilvus TaxID=2304675 RepID=UPI000F78FF42|nr:CotH kinase family protein [Antribacter gilvus]
MPRPLPRASIPVILTALALLLSPLVASTPATGAPVRTVATTAAVDPGLAGDITFSVPSRTFTGSLRITLGTTVAGAQVRYTTDGSVPSASSPLYSSPLDLTRSTEVRAQAFVGGSPSGKPGSAQYVATGVTTTHDLPVLLLDSFGRGAVGDTDHPVAAMEFQPAGGTTSLTATPTLATRAGYRLRGQSSRTFDKKPYRLELWDNTGDDLDLPLAGMPAESDWVLRGPFPDKALVREALVYDLGREMGLDPPRYRLVELYVNDDAQPVAANDYRGVYLLVETIKNQKNRLDLKKLDPEDVNPPDVEGGYIIKFEWMAAEEPLLRCTGATATCWTDLEVHDPDDLVPAQQQYIQGYVQRLNDLLHSPGYADPVTGYASMIDVDSFVDMMIVNELSRNMDAYYRSQYFYKDRGGKLTAGPLWDFDLTFSVGGYFGNNQVQGWQYQQTRQPIAFDWYTVLVRDPAFQNRVKVRWQELRRGPLSDSALQQRVSALTAPLPNAAARNFARWPNLTTPTIGYFTTPTAATWTGQVDVMRSWMLRRAQWLDTTHAWGGPTTPPPTPTPSVTPGPGPSVSPSPTPTPTATATATPTPTANPGAACAATFTTTSRWPGGFQGDVTVAAGSAALRGWTVTLTFPSGITVQQAWNATVTISSSTVTARNVSWNGSLAAGGRTTFGFIGNGEGTPTVTCAAA